MVVVDRELAGLEAAAQLAVGGLCEEAGAERLDGDFDAAAELVEGAGAVGAGLVRPAFQVAGAGRVACEPARVANEPAEREVGVLLAAEHGLEVELAVRLAGERRRVAQQS